MIAVVPPSRTRFVVVAFVVLLLAIVGSISYVGWRQSVPGVKVTTTPPRLVGHRTALTVGLAATRGHIAQAEARVLQGGRSAVVARLEPPLGARAELPVTIEASAIGLREGEAMLEVRARDDFWRPLRVDERAIAQFPLTVDLTPPKLEVLGATPYISPGGAGIVAFRAPDAARAEVKVGTRVFPSFAMGPAEKAARVALFALAYDFAPGTPLTVTAQDDAGNVTARAIPGELKPRPFPHDTIQVRDAFLERKVPELLPQRNPAQPLLEGFLVINRDQRRQAEEEKLKVGARTADKPLWEGPFVQPRNTKVFSNFAETRTYVYQGKQVDTQVHYGYDLAATRQAPVPAANRGAVVYTGPLTIYGNTVILDHGLGLQTLYAHLSSVDVKVGDTVDKGQVLGHSGATGLAMGDHLHFEVLVHGVSVTPLEWWDAKWIRDRLNKPLREAGLPEIAGMDAPAGDDRAATTGRRRR